MQTVYYDEYFSINKGRFWHWSRERREKFINYTGVIIKKNRDEYRFKNGVLHQEDGPAIIKNKTYVWYYEGKIHRLNGPAIISNSGRVEFYINGKRHRDNGPAVHTKDKVKKWYKYGILHREDGPAIESPNGEYYYYKKGRLHREDGPAIYLTDLEHNCKTRHRLRQYNRKNKNVKQPEYYKEWRINGFLKRLDSDIVAEFDKLYFMKKEKDSLKEIRINPIKVKVRGKSTVV